MIAQTITSVLLAASAASAAPPKLDRSGHALTGLASFYGVREAGRTNASGAPLALNKMTAASRSLPLGTKARVTARESGKTAEVRVNDRGPYVPGRIIDVTPKAAQQLGLRSKGVAKVEVEPLTEPPPK